jgi:hypothetical protein
MVDFKRAALALVIADRVGRVTVSEMDIAGAVAHVDSRIFRKWICRVRLREDALVTHVVEVDFREVVPYPAIALLSGPACAAALEPDEELVPRAGADGKRVLSAFGADRVSTRAQQIPSDPQFGEAWQSRGFGARWILC